MDGEFGISRHDLLYIEWMKNKGLQYSIGNYIQYPVINFSIKEYENAGTQWTSEEPGIQQSMESQRAGHDLVSEQQQRRKTKSPHRALFLHHKERYYTDYAFFSSFFKTEIPFGTSPPEIQETDRHIFSSSLTHLLQRHFRSHHIPLYCPLKHLFSDLSSSSQFPGNLHF